MSNRAVITTRDKKLGVYLHWNGGRDSVEGFLGYCKLKGYSTPETDSSYGFARLTQVIANFFGGDSSVGIGLYDELNYDNYDNGVYIIENWEIVGREFNRGFEQNEYDKLEFMKVIDNKMPKEEQLGELLDATLTKTKDLQIGDNVFIKDFKGKYFQAEIIGFGLDEIVNGKKVLGLPYIDKYNLEYHNINNYLTKKEYYKK